MASQTKDSDTVPRSSQRTFMEDLIVTFSSPMAWLLMIALIITWAGVAIVLFDLLDYATLAGTSSLPPPSSIGKRGMKARAARPLKAAVAAAAASAATSEESSDWLQSLWSLVAGLVAPEDEEEGIHQLTDPFTSFHSEEL